MDFLSLKVLDYNFLQCFLGLLKYIFVITKPECTGVF